MFKNQYSVDITAVYRSPTSDEHEILDILNIPLNHVGSGSYDIRIFTSFANIDLLKENDHISSQYLNILSEFDYLSIISEPTRVQSFTKTCIGHILPKTKPEYFDCSVPLVLRKYYGPLHNYPTNCMG